MKPEVFKLSFTCLSNMYLSHFLGLQVMRLILNIIFSGMIVVLAY